jgi:hypothetical protein
MRPVVNSRGHLLCKCHSFKCGRKVRSQGVWLPRSTWRGHQKRDEELKAAARLPCDEPAAENGHFWGGDMDFSEDDLERNNHGGTEREQERDGVLPPFEEPEAAAEDFAIINADLELLD